MNFTIIQRLIHLDRQKIQPSFKEIKNLNYSLPFKFN